MDGLFSRRRERQGAEEGVAVRVEEEEARPGDSGRRVGSHPQEVDHLRRCALSLSLVVPRHLYLPATLPAHALERAARVFQRVQDPAAVSVAPVFL